MQRVDKRAMWIGGTRDKSRLCSRADSNTSVPVSAIPHCAVVTPASHANSASRERRSSRSITRPFFTDCRSRCTSGASEPTTRRAPASVRIRASAAAASASVRTTVHCAPTAVSCSVKCLTTSPLSGTERGTGGEDAGAERRSGGEDSRPWAKFSRIACRISRRASPLRITITLITQARTPLLAKALRREGTEIAPLGPRAQPWHDAQPARDAHHPLEEARPRHQRRIDRKRQPLAQPPLPDAGIDHLGAQVKQQRRDVDLDGTDVPAGTAQTRGVGEGGRAREPEQLGAQHRADRTGIDGPVRMAADLAVHRTGVETGAAPYTGERLSGDGRGQHARAAVVQHHDVQLFRPLVLRSPLCAREKRLICREHLAGPGSGEQLQKDVEVREARDHLLDSHERDVGARETRREPCVALVLEDEDRARLGHREVDARYAEVRLGEAATQRGAGRGRQRGDVVGGRDSEFVREQRGDLGLGLVEGGHDDVRWRLAGQLDDVLAQVRFHWLDVTPGEGRVEVDLLRGHALALHHRPGATPLGDRADEVARFGCIARPMHPCAGALGVRRELLEVAIQVLERLVLDRAGPVACTLPVRHRGEGRPPPLAEQRRRLAQSTTQLAVGQRGACVALEGHLDANTSARCMARTIEPRRDSRPAICIRQLASPDTTASTPARSMASTFSSRMATEISGYFTENVPPKPQHASAFGSSTSSAPVTRRSSLRGSSLIPRSRRPWQASCQVSRPEKLAPTSSTPSWFTRKALSSCVRSATPLARARQAESSNSWS